MSKINLYPEMDEKIAGLLRMVDDPIHQYAAALVETLLREKVEREKGCEWCGVKKLAIPIMYNGEECGKAWLYEADDGWALFLGRKLEED